MAEFLYYAIPFFVLLLAVEYRARPRRVSNDLTKCAPSDANVRTNGPRACEPRGVRRAARSAAGETYTGA